MNKRYYCGYTAPNLKSYHYIYENEYHSNRNRAQCRFDKRRRRRCAYIRSAYRNSVIGIIGFVIISDLVFENFISLRGNIVHLRIVRGRNIIVLYYQRHISIVARSLNVTYRRQRRTYRNIYAVLFFCDIYYLFCDILASQDTFDMIVMLVVFLAVVEYIRTEFNRQNRTSREVDTNIHTLRHIFVFYGKRSKYYYRNKENQYGSNRPNTVLFNYSCFLWHFHLKTPPLSIFFIFFSTEEIS